MNKTALACRELGAKRFRETFDLCHEDFEIGDDAGYRYRFYSRVESGRQRSAELRAQHADLQTEALTRSCSRKLTSCVRNLNQELFSAPRAGRQSPAWKYAHDKCGLECPPADGRHVSPRFRGVLATRFWV